MFKTTKKNKPLDASEQEAHIKFIRSLFADQKNLVSGLLLQVCVISYYVYNSGNPLFFGFIVTTAIFTGWRYNLGRIYKDKEEKLRGRELETQVTFAAKWERKALIPITLSAINIGIFCSLGLINAENDLQQGIVYCMLFATMPTIVGRIYGSLKLAGFVLIGIFAPMVIGYAVKSDLPHLVLAIMCIPYIALVLEMVKNVRATVTNAARGNAEKIELGRKFNVALRNMSHGLMMFDDNQRVMIINEQALNLFNIPLDLSIAGRHVQVLMRYAQRFDGLSITDSRMLKHNVQALLDGKTDKKQLYFKDGRYLEFRASDRSAGGTVITFEDTTDRMKAANKIEKMAQYDGLTELPNRKFFQKLIEKKIKKARPEELCALFVLDVDDFKHVNDSLGHTQGDALLKSIADYIKPRTKDNYVSSRLGGDEFLVFVSGLSDNKAARKFANSLSKRLCRIHDLVDEQVYISCSIGFVTQKMGSFSQEEAIIQADLALYETKRGGKGSWMQFAKSMDDQYQRRQRIKKQLAKAVQSDSLNVIYQPLVDAKTGKLVACEALSRWHDTEYGQLSPSEYIPLAEEMGIITQITKSTIKRATHECAKWPDHVSVSVNLSAVDFRSGDILNIIEEALNSSGLKPSRLEIEVTETAVASNEREMIEKLEAITNLGVRVALDDFGTGQSSLSYLNKLPLNKVKIDRSFVVGIDTGETPIELLHGVTELCRTLNLDVTVEGVETARQLELVVSEGKVDRIQGYIYGPGLPASGINALASLGKLPYTNNEFKELKKVYIQYN